MASDCDGNRGTRQTVKWPHTVHRVYREEVEVSEFEREEAAAEEMEEEQLDCWRLGWPFLKNDF